MIFLFLNDISTGEVLVILVFILMFFGSKSIPNMARTFGRTLRQIRDATDDIKRDIRNSTAEIEKEITGARDKFNEGSKTITDSFGNQAKSLEDISKKFKNTLESSGKETISSKRKPITEKFDPEEASPEAPETIKEQNTKPKDDATPDNTDKKESIGYAESVAGNRKKSDDNQTEQPVSPGDIKKNTKPDKAAEA